MRCTFRRRTFGPPFEVTIQRGSEVVRRVAFERDEEAADFAIDAMRRADARVTDPLSRSSLDAPERHQEGRN
jgi:hypothetical protein